MVTSIELSHFSTATTNRTSLYLCCDASLCKWYRLRDYWLVYEPLSFAEVAVTEIYKNIGGFLHRFASIALHTGTKYIPRAYISLGTYQWHHFFPFLYNHCVSFSFGINIGLQSLAPANSAADLREAFRCSPNGQDLQTILEIVHQWTFPYHIRTGLMYWLSTCTPNVLIKADIGKFYFPERKERTLREKRYHEVRTHHPPMHRRMLSNLVRK